ncbi:hypothetical protein ACROYT_G042827 [Oculina patagonica]
MGLATAVFLAKDDEKRFKVYSTMRNLAKKGQLEEEGKEYLGDTLIIKQMDVCSDESVEKAVKEVLDTEGRIDVLIKAVLPSMKARQSGHIINNNSVAGIVGIPFFDIYSASKFAIEGLSESLAPRLRQFDIRYTILETGPVETPILQTAEDWGKAIDHETADQKTTRLKERRIIPPF